MMPLCMTATRPSCAEVRVGVAVVGRAVRRPAGVADAGASRPAAGAPRAPCRGWPACRLLVRADRAVVRRARPRRSRSRGTPAGAGPRSPRPRPAAAPTYPTIPHMGASSTAATAPPLAAGATAGRHAAQVTSGTAPPAARLPVRRARPGRLGRAGARHRAAADTPRRSTASAASATSSTWTRSSRSTCRCPACSTCTSRAPAPLHRATETFLTSRSRRARRSSSASPGSVAVGKSTTARVLQQMLARWPEHPRVELVTTDGFLLPNAELRAPRDPGPQGLPGVLRPPGAAALRDRHQVRQGRGRRADVLPPHLRHRPRRGGRGPQARHPDRRGAQRAAAGAVRDRRPHRPRGQRLLRLLHLRRRGAPATSAGGTSTASCGCARPRSATRSRTSPATPTSPTTRRSSEANRIWDTINGPNLEQNILPTRGRATLVLRKDRTTRSAGCASASSEGLQFPRLTGRCLTFYGEASPENDMDCRRTPPVSSDPAASSAPRRPGLNQAISRATGVSERI